MAIQLNYVKPDNTSGNYWKVTGANFAIDGTRTTIMVTVSLYKSAADAEISTVTPMLSKSVIVPANVFTNPQLNLLKTTLQNAVIANDASFTTGTVVA